MLRKLALGAIVAAVTLMAASPASAQISGTSVSGAGWNDARELITVSAHSTPTGVRGHASSRVLDESGNLLRWVSGPVTCLYQVSSTSVVVAIRITHSAGYDDRLPPANAGFVFYLEDNGKPGEDDAPDIIGTGFVASPLTDCSNTGQGGATPFIRGDIRITNSV